MPASRPAAVIPPTVTPPATKPKLGNHIPMPKIVHGIHVSLAVAGSPSHMSQFFNLTAKGLNTLEIDVKDENGQVGFVAGAPALAKKIGATRNYYNARQLIREAHAAGIYVIGRIVCFEDPILSQADAAARDPHHLGRRLDERPGPRLDERVRPVRLELHHLAQQGRREDGLRRDPVRLRALPDRRQRLRRRLAA